MKHTFLHCATLTTACLLAAWPAGTQARPTPREDPPAAGNHRDAPPATAASGKTAVLGVVVERIDDELRYQLPVIQPGAGLIIRNIMKNGPAAQTNMAVMDILLKWNDQLLVHPAQLRVLVESSQPGDTVNMEYLHMGALTKARITLAEKSAPAGHGAGHHAMGWRNHAPEAGSAALAGSQMLEKAVRALAKSGIHSNMVADILKDVDPNTIAGILKLLDAPNAGPAPAGGGKIVIIAPDGTRKEINLAEALKPDANIGDVLKAVDFGKSDPATWLNSKILWIRPDGTQHEIHLGDILKSRGLMNDLLKGLAAPGSPWP